MVWARVNQQWVQADYVWAYHNDAWQLLWGRTPGAPDSATATWLAPATIQIDWELPDVHANTHWIVKRSDGTTVATVPVSQLSVVDTRPLLANTTITDSTVAPYTVQGTDGSAVSVSVATNTVTFNLTPDTQSGVVSYPNSTTSTVTMSWTPNATYGAPQGWRLYNPTDGFITDVLPGTTTSYALTNQRRGYAWNYRVVPFTRNAAGTWVQAGDADNELVDLKAAEPPSVTLAATTSPASNLRLSWGTPEGGRSGFEVETSTNGSTWTPLGTTTALSDNWSTMTGTGYMRVRTLPATGSEPSDWVQRGPVAAINDTTPPNNVTWISFKPESSYGRMVARFTYPTDPGGVERQGQYRVNGGSWQTSHAWSSVGGGGQDTSFLIGTFSGGQTIDVRINVRDGFGNTRTGSVQSYTLQYSPIVINPSGSLSGTFRDGGWRNDSTRSSTELATGWTSSGRNYGCYFYGTTIANAIGDKTITSATIEYFRENEGGQYAAVQPLFWTHQLTSRSGTPSVNAHGVSESSRLGSGVARTGTTGGVWSIATAFINALKSGSARGLCMYRNYEGSGNPDNYYALLDIGGQTGGSPSRVNGQLNFNHLG